MTADYLAEQNDHIQRATLLLAATLLTHPEERVIPAAGCEHCLTVAVNNRQAVCVLCRSTIDGPRSCGLTITGPKDPPPPVSCFTTPPAEPDTIPAITHFMGYLGKDHISEIAACDLTDHGTNGPSQSGTFHLGGIIGPAKDVANFLKRFGDVIHAKDNWLRFSRAEEGPGDRYEGVVLTSTGRQFTVADKMLVSSLQFMYIRKTEV